MISLWSLLSRVLIEQFDVMCYPMSLRLSSLISPSNIDSIFHQCLQAPKTIHLQGHSQPFAVKK